MDLKKVLRRFKFKERAEGDYDLPPTFKEELNRQCNAIVLRASILAIFSWPLFIPLDMELHGDVPFVFYLRVGLSVVGLISFLLHFLPFFRKRGYWLLIFIIYYLGSATAWILGLVGADPVYMGGFAIVILIFGLMPFQRIHTLLLLLLTLVLFTVIGHHRGMELVLPAETYGLYNLIISAVIALLSIFVFDKIRETSYKNAHLLQHTNEELHKANELKNHLLQVAAHDLKDPLQVIIGYTDLLQMKLKENKFANERLKIIHRSTDRMIKLIADLLEITSIESGKLAMHQGEVDLGEVVEASVNSYQRDSQKKNQLLQAAVEKNCLVYGDHMLLRQIVNHLISNAIKFSPPGKSIWVALNQQGDSVVLKVRDEGPGIHENEIDKLFNKFQRLSTRPTAGEISTGLGLAITRDLVEMHHGSIIVQSEPEKGTTFIVNLPLLKKETINPPLPTG